MLRPVLLKEFNTSRGKFPFFLACLSSLAFSLLLIVLTHVSRHRLTTHIRMGPDWPVRRGVLVYETRDPVLLVSGKVRHAQDQRLDRSDERSKRGSERTEGGGNVHPRSFVSNPSFLFRFFKFLLAKIQQNIIFLDKTLFFFLPFFLFPKRLCVLKRIKSLRKSVQRSLSISISVLRLFLAPPVLPGCTSNEPTAHIIVTVLRLFPARLVLPSCTCIEPTAHCKSW
jgi:hypothetical protein